MADRKPDAYRTNTGRVFYYDGLHWRRFPSGEVLIGTIDMLEALAAKSTPLYLSETP